MRPRGGILSAGFAVKMPYNYITSSGTLLEVTFEERLKMYDGWLVKRGEILKAVKNKQKGPFETGPRARGTTYPGGSANPLFCRLIRGSVLERPGGRNPPGHLAEASPDGWPFLPRRPMHQLRNLFGDLSRGEY